MYLLFLRCNCGPQSEMALDVDLLVTGIFCLACWLPFLIAHAVYLWRKTTGHIILVEVVNITVLHF